MKENRELVKTHLFYQKIVSVIEGMAICAYVMGATKAYNYLREMLLQYERCEQALKDAAAAGLLGKDCLGSGVDIEIFNVLGAGSYIVGEKQPC